MTIQCVIFDCDGVLVDSEPPTLWLLRDDLEAHGLPLTLADIERDYTGLLMSNVAKRRARRAPTYPMTGCLLSMKRCSCGLAKVCHSWRVSRRF